MAICQEDRTKDIVKKINITPGETKNIILTINNTEFDNTHNEIRFRIVAGANNATFYMDNLQLIQTP